MSETMIIADKLGKKYRIRHEQQERYTTLRDVLSRKFYAPLKVLRRWSRPPRPPAPTYPGRSSANEDFWALKDVSFEVQQGECVGIIGRNGAGKSTLLKILSRITEPTSGRARIRGRIASLLEVGTGFHPELTGRENVFLNGAILGMTKAEMKTKFDQIVAFAEVERFLDTPVKRYSSGMYVRLAFAVASHLEAEILIVDEVLAVGDAAFQKKCLGRLWEVGKGGLTVLFVSHNMVTINALCSRAILLEDGKFVEEGTATAITALYLKRGVADARTAFYEAPEQQIGPGIRISRIRLCDNNGDTNDVYTMGSRLTVEVDIRTSLRIDGLRLAIIISEQNDSPIYQYLNVDSGIAIDCPEGGIRAAMTTPPLMLYPGTYALAVHLCDSRSEDLDAVNVRISFDIVQEADICQRRLPRSSGLVFAAAQWKIVSLPLESGDC